MALAEVFEKRWRGRRRPVEFTRLRRQPRRARPDAPVRITVRSPVAVAYLAQAPGELGLARAYVAGHLDVDGDMYTALARMTGGTSPSLTLAETAAPAAARSAARSCCCHRVPPPPQEVHADRRWLVGQRHSKARDARRSPTTTTCPTGSTSGCSGRRWPTPAPAIPREDATLEEAQDAQVRPGRPQAGPAAGHAAAGRRLRLGRHGHARGPGVRREGARRDAVRASRPRGRRRRSSEAGLAELAEVRHLDYRDVPETGFDAVSSIGLTEHIGKAATCRPTSRSCTAS